MTKWWVWQKLKYSDLRSRPQQREGKRLLKRLEAVRAEMEAMKAVRNQNVIEGRFGHSQR
jgi:hypothetical protein